MVRNANTLNLDRFIGFRILCIATNGRLGVTTLGKAAASNMARLPTCGCSSKNAVVVVIAGLKWQDPAIVRLLSIRYTLVVPNVYVADPLTQEDPKGPRFA